MFHPIFLQFNYEVLEKEYMNEQKEKIRYDFTLYFIFAEFIVGMLAASNISTKTYQLALVNIMLMVFLILSFIIIRKVPFYLKLILPILQISYCLNFRFQLQLENLSKIDTYFQGSISLFLTFATLFQGQHMKCSFILVPTTILYLTMIEKFDFQQYVCCAQFLCAYIGMVMLKYNMERSNRIAFLEARENQKWISLMENSVNNNVIFIFNRKRVQLDFSIATKQLMKEFFLGDTDDIKQLIRNFHVKTSQKMLTLEEYVLEQLQQFKKFKDIEDIPIIYKINNQVYKVKIMYIFNRGQQKILFRIQQDQKKIDPKKEASLLLMNQRRIIKYMSKLLSESFYKKFTQNLNAKSFNLLIQMSMIQCTLNKNYYNHIMETKIIEVEQFCLEIYKCINKIYNGFTIKFLLQGNQYLNISESGLTFLLVTIIQIFTKSDKGNITLKVSGLQYGLINFKLEISNYNPKASKITSLLQLNELYYNKQASYNEQQSLIWDYFCALCLNNTSKKISKPFILQLTLLKYLILRFTSKGNLDIITTQDTAIISFDIIQENFTVLSNPQITFTTPRVDTKLLIHLNR